MAPINEWLRVTRERQIDPETGEPLSQERLVSRINDWARERGLLNEHGQPWVLHRPNYGLYEREANPREPKADTRRRLVEYWADQDEPGPESMAQRQPEHAPSLEERAVIAAELQAAALARIAAHLTGVTLPDPRHVAESQAWGLAALAALRQPRPSAAPGQ